MGDRSNLFIQQVKRPEGYWDGIGLYSHWDGANLHKTALEVLPMAAGRVGDPSYFTRILVQNVLDQLADADSETGFGLWVDGPDDNEHPILVINALTGESWMARETEYRSDNPEGKST